MAGPSSSGNADADGGLFAVPTTLPPNSRHGKLFLTSKEPELTLRQHLDTISVSLFDGFLAVKYATVTKTIARTKPNALKTCKLTKIFPCLGIQAMLACYSRSIFGTVIA